MQRGCQRLQISSKNDRVEQIYGMVACVTWRQSIVVERESSAVLFLVHAQEDHHSPTPCIAQPSRLLPMRNSLLGLRHVSVVFLAKFCENRSVGFGGSAWCAWDRNGRDYVMRLAYRPVQFYPGAVTSLVWHFGVCLVSSRPSRPSPSPDTGCTRLLRLLRAGRGPASSPRQRSPTSTSSCARGAMVTK